MTKSFEETDAEIRDLEDEIILLRDSSPSDDVTEARLNKARDKLKVLLRRAIVDLHPSFYKDNADIEEHIRIGICLSNHYARLNDLIPENSLESTSLAERFNEVSDELRELRKRSRGRMRENHGNESSQPDSASLNIANGAFLKESALGERHGNDKAQPLLVVVPNQAVHDSPNPEVPRPSSPWQNVGLSELPQKIIEELNKPETQVLENRDENEPHGYVKFSFPASVVGISPCLVSDRIMKDVRMIDPEMLVPVDQVEVLLESGRCVALIGVSGCGKTRTCYDLCRSGRWYGLYFDWSSHIDLAHFKDELESIRKKYLIEDYKKFLERSETVIKKILICRLLVLQLLISKHGGTYCKKRFLLLQQYATTRDNLLVKIACGFSGEAKGDVVVDSIT